MKHQILSALLVLGVACSIPAAQAYELKELDDPVRVISGVPLHYKALKKGADFHATLEEAVEYQGWTLPEGTQFIGHVDSHRHDRHGAHPHRMEVWVDQAVFPNGQKYTIYPNEQIEPNTKFHAWTWNGRRAMAIDPGERMYLEFKPAIMKGMFYTAAKK